MKKIVTAAFILFSRYVTAQEIQTPPLIISGYVETYYTYDFNKPATNTLPTYLYNFNRANEVNINLAYLKTTYLTNRTRANFTLALGTYMNANYAVEPGLLKNIYEANIGLRLSAKHNLWLDAGVLPSHIGWESAIGKDNATLTRSLAAENSPYFEAGARLSYIPAGSKWYLSAQLLNGWQRIQRVDGNTTPAFGTQVTYKPSSKISLNSSTFIGSDQPDSLRRMRYFHDLYGSFQLGNRWLATAGFDIGLQQKTKGSSALDSWYTAALILKYAAGSNFSLAARAEHYADKKGVIISTGSGSGFKTWGFSGNADYLITGNLLWRVELRSFHSKYDPALTTSLSLSF